MTGLTFVSCINRPEVARDCLLASPCLASGSPHQVLLAQGMRSAAEGFRWAVHLARHPWIVLLHQDVYLPVGWDLLFQRQIAAALAERPRTTIAGVYGVRADGAHEGHVFDRDRWLGSPFSQPRAVRSLDELLLATRRDSGLVIDPELGWHLYGTDLCLQAAAAGQVAVVVDAPCEHRSTLPRALPTQGEQPDAALQAQVAAFNASARVLAARWPLAMPVTTPVTTIDAGRALEMPL